MNSVTLIGRMVADPEVFDGTSKAGKEYTRTTFTLAVNREGSEADFIRCVAFGKVASSIGKFMKKGSQIGIQGSIRTGKYTNKEGRTVNTFDVNVFTADFLDRRNSNNRDGGVGDVDDGGFNEADAFMPMESDIPF